MSDFVTWNIDPAQYFHDLTLARVQAIEQDIVSLADSLTGEITSFMQREARWQDRTGEARAGLYSDVEHVARQAVYILLSHGPAIDYAWFLEYAHSGRFEILSTTADHVWPIFYRGVMAIVQHHSG